MVIARKAESVAAMSQPSEPREDTEGGDVQGSTHTAVYGSASEIVRKMGPTPWALPRAEQPQNHRLPLAKGVAPGPAERHGGAPESTHGGGDPHPNTSQSQASG